MNIVQWGLLGPETVAGSRRTRTLGVGAAVRAFNDLAVPGLGGVWFGKQIYLAALGVAAADAARSSGLRVQNIEVANATEALACRLALTANGWVPDPRLRGARKMHAYQDVRFAIMRKPGFYVTQPMRQATVQALRALGFVESVGERFNAFRTTDVGTAFLALAGADCKPYYSRSVVEHLVQWVLGEHDKVWPLTPALSPLTPLPAAAREILRERIAQGPPAEARRREAALRWVAGLRENPADQSDWSTRPPMIDETHWQDLHAGAQFFAVRDAAITLLDGVEAHIGAQGERQSLSVKSPLPAPIRENLRAVRVAAEQFLNKAYDPSPDLVASRVCRECTSEDDAKLLTLLVARCEGRGVQQRSSGDIVPGIAFRGGQVQADTARGPEDEGEETEIQQPLLLPDGISRRVRNLFYLHLDLHGELGAWLGEPATEGGPQ